MAQDDTPKFIGLAVINTGLCLLMGAYVGINLFLSWRDVSLGHYTIYAILFLTLPGTYAVSLYALVYQGRRVVQLAYWWNVIYTIFHITSIVGI